MSANEDLPISLLDAAQTPLAGTEPMAIVQNGETVQTPVQSIVNLFSTTVAVPIVTNVDPTANDDINSGIAVPRLWLNNADPTVPRLFFCSRNSAGNAFWVRFQTA